MELALPIELIRIIAEYNIGIGTIEEPVKERLIWSEITGDKFIPHMNNGASLYEDENETINPEILKYVKYVDVNCTGKKLPEIRKLCPDLDHLTGVSLDTRKLRELKKFGKLKRLDVWDFYEKMQDGKIPVFDIPDTLEEFLYYDMSMGGTISFIANITGNNLEKIRLSNSRKKPEQYTRYFNIKAPNLKALSLCNYDSNVEINHLKPHLQYFSCGVYDVFDVLEFPGFTALRKLQLQFDIRTENVVNLDLRNLKTLSILELVNIDIYSGPRLKKIRIQLPHHLLLIYNDTCFQTDEYEGQFFEMSFE